MVSLKLHLYLLDGAINIIDFCTLLMFPMILLAFLKIVIVNSFSFSVKLVI